MFISDDNGESNFTIGSLSDERMRRLSLRWAVVWHCPYGWLIWAINALEKRNIEFRPDPQHTKTSHKCQPWPNFLSFSMCRICSYLFGSERAVPSSDDFVKPKTTTQTSHVPKLQRCVRLAAGGLSVVIENQLSDQTRRAKICYWAISPHTHPESHTEQLLRLRYAPRQSVAAMDGRP